MGVNQTPPGTTALASRWCARRTIGLATFRVLAKADLDAEVADAALTTALELEGRAARGGGAAEIVRLRQPPKGLST